MMAGTELNDGGKSGIAARRREVAMALMEELQPIERIVVVLRYGEQLEISEIANVIHCSEQQVDDTLTGVEGRIRGHLQQELAC